MPEPWFHVASLPPDGGVIELEEQEARHARGAARLGVGDAVMLFDGFGATARGEVCEAGRRRLEVRTEAIVRHPHPTPALHVASALPKGDRLAQLLSTATQLGMSSFTPLHCRYSVTRATPRTAERFARIVREACKQSRRAFAPTLDEERTPAELASPAHPDEIHVVLDRNGRSAEILLSSPALRDAGAIKLFVGPEGGFDPTERDALAHAAAHSLVVSDGVLRIETAVAAGLAVLGQLRLR